MSITSADAIFTIQVPGLYPVPQVIEGFSVDESFMSDDVTMGEAQMGVDGKASFGKVPYLTPLNVTLQADSKSTVVFDNIKAAQDTRGNDLYPTNVIIIIRATGEKWALTNGPMLTATAIPKGGKVLGPRKFGFQFESCAKAPV